MTRTDPLTISLENHMKKVPYEGRTRYSDEAGKTRTALLKKRTDQGLSDASSKVKQFQCCHRSQIFLEL